MYYLHDLTINSVKFFVCFVPNLTITFPNVYTRRASDKAIILQSVFLDVLHTHSNG